MGVNDLGQHREHLRVFALERAPYWYLVSTISVIPP